jgi:ABC-type lipoprotein export system ATPase subunit
MMTEGMMLKLIDIKKRYGETKIFDGLQLELASGTIISVSGPSGSGKTTLFNMLGTLDGDYEGDIFFDGKNIADMTEKEKLVFRNERIGFVFQGGYLLPQCNVMENILLPTIPSGGKNKGYYERASELLDRVGMKDKADSMPLILSGGECQRVALVRALIKKPVLVIADEPTGSLDQDNAGNIGNLLVDINRQEKTTMIVFTHSEKLALIADKKFLISDKKLAEK